MNIALINTLITTLAGIVVAYIGYKSGKSKVEQQAEFERSVIQQDISNIKERLSELSTTDDSCKMLSKDFDEFREMLTTTSATLNQFKAESDLADEALKETMKAICRDRINQGHRYFMKRGSIDERSKESLLSIGECYIKILNGNTFVESEIKDLNSLPCTQFPTD